MLPGIEPCVGLIIEVRPGHRMEPVMDVRAVAGNLAEQQVDTLVVEVAEGTAPALRDCGAA